MNKLSAVIFLFFILAGSLAAEKKKFLSASSGYSWNFPKDHGSHDNFETEWWYITGHLADVGKNIFDGPTNYGFQITFFRRANLESKGKISQNYLAHAALTDIAGNNFIHAQRNSDNLLAGASTGSLEVWNNDWELKQYADDSFGAIVYLSYKPLIKISYDFKIVQDYLFHGDNGYSKKADCQDCASMYYSIPRLETTAVIEREGTKQELKGISWFDHEFFTNILSSQQIGWDWFNLMFKDGSNLMAFAVRNKTDPRHYVSGTYQKDGIVKNLGREDINWEVLEKSQMKSGTIYPTAWNVLLKDSNLKLQLGSLLKEQEITSNQPQLPSYWEGAIRAENSVGYFEMTGYDAPVK